MEPQPSDLVVFEHDKELVLEAFGNGEFDPVEVVSEVAERHFFDFLKTQTLLEELAASYPTPRVKQEVPVWFYLRADLALRLHGRHSFHSFPYVVRSGGLRSLLAPQQWSGPKGDWGVPAESYFNTPGPVSGQTQDQSRETTVIK